jgi:hypothetical protein
MVFLGFFIRILRLNIKIRYKRILSHRTQLKINSRLQNGATTMLRLQLINGNQTSLIVELNNKTSAD